MQLSPSPYKEDRLVVSSDLLLDHSIASQTHLATSLQVAVGELWILLMVLPDPLWQAVTILSIGAPQPDSTLGLGFGMSYLLR